MDGAFTINEHATETSPVRVSLLGGQVDLVTPDHVMAFTAQAIAQRRQAVVANHNLHSLHLLRRSEPMRRFYALADIVEADSTPLIAWGRLLGWPIGRQHRCTYLDWRGAFWSLAQGRGWKVFYLGSAPGVAEQGAVALKRRYPGVSIATHDGYFDVQGAGNQQVLDAITAFAPDVLMVGMGMPRQEAWAADNLQALPPCVIFTVGAAFDYEAGVQRAAPRWTGPLGLEWLFRFISDPGRLFSRYFIEPWSLIVPALRDLTRRPRAAPQR
jgi:N-acetylglucosaminyldiphosphoundecaprenol N-acetyl-beta-D-mannosaminyltransferase